MWIWVDGIAHTMVDDLDFPFTISIIIFTVSRNVVSCHLSSECPVIVPRKTDPLHVLSWFLSRMPMAIRGWYSKAFPSFPSRMTLKGQYNPVLHEIYYSVTIPNCDSSLCCALSELLVFVVVFILFYFWRASIKHRIFFLRTTIFFVFFI